MKCYEAEEYLMESWRARVAFAIQCASCLAGQFVSSQRRPPNFKSRSPAAPAAIPAFCLPPATKHPPLASQPHTASSMAPKAEKKPAKKVAVKKADGKKTKKSASKAETYKVRPWAQARPVIRAVAVVRRSCSRCCGASSWAGCCRLGLTAWPHADLHLQGAQAGAP